MRNTTIFAFVVSVGVGTVLLNSGCDNNDRTPTSSAIKAADTKRQNYIDTLPLPADQKAIMKSHVGGAPVANPAAKAANGANNEPDRK